MTLYLSGPITGVADYAKRFAHAARLLESHGYTVINPVEGTDGTLSYAEYMRRDLALVLTCEGIALIDGWGQSRGATMEKSVGAMVGLELRTVDEWVAIGDEEAAQ